jgi:hypothetical protein
MDWNKTYYIFFALMSLTTTSGFLYENNLLMITLALCVNLISTIIKLSSQKKVYSMSLLTSSFVADLHLIPAWYVLYYHQNHFLSTSFAIGAVLANLYAMMMIVIEMIKNSKNFDDDLDY